MCCSQMLHYQRGLLVRGFGKLLLVSMAMTACSTRDADSNRLDSAPDGLPQTLPVTLVPPESASQRALDEAGFLDDAKVGGMVRNLIVLEFERDAPLPQRRAAIASVRGNVIGGTRFIGDSTDGAYYVRVGGRSAA